MFTKPSTMPIVTLCSIFLIAGSAAFAENLAPNSGGSFSNIGKKIFERRWQPGSQAGGGLGPLYNATSCAACHIDLGRGRPPGQGTLSFLMRFSVQPSSEIERLALALEQKPFLPHPVYGGQLQDKAIEGTRAEGRVRVDYVDQPYTLGDGSVVMLQRPVYSIDGLSRGVLADNVLLSPRIAQPIKGMGQIDTIPDREILANEDPHDIDNDGISGRANRVRNVQNGTKAIGRFGWKATQPNLVQQIASAFAQDIGISSILFAEAGKGCLDTLQACGPDKAETGESTGAEISLLEILRVADYLRARSRPANEYSGSGKALFSQIGCASCHLPSLLSIVKSGRNNMKLALPVTLYSDLLLHDMGAGLADHRPVADASGWEWRTQPLWGLGSAGNKGDRRLLHDGRARTISEAILWHGGEAKAARAKFAALAKGEREKLLGFLRGL